MLDEEIFEEARRVSYININEFIDLQKQFIRGDHDLECKLRSIEAMLFKFMEELEDENLFNLNDEVFEVIQELISMIESDRLKDIRFYNEELAILKHLNDDVESKDWRAVKHDTKYEIIGQKKVLRLEREELKEMHSKFMDILKLMKRSKLLKHLNDDFEDKTRAKKIIESYEFYFNQIYKLANFYERIFRHMWRKERIIYKKMK